MTTKSETYIVRKILTYIKELGGDGYHVHGNSMQRAGEPDIDGWIPSEICGFIHLKLEVKTLKGKPTTLQLYRIKQYQQAGYCAGVVTSRAEAMRLIEIFEENYVNDI